MFFCCLHNFQQYCNACKICKSFLVSQKVFQKFSRSFQNFLTSLFGGYQKDFNIFPEVFQNIFGSCPKGYLKLTQNIQFYLSTPIQKDFQKFSRSPKYFFQKFQSFCESIPALGQNFFCKFFTIYFLIFNNLF